MIPGLLFCSCANIVEFNPSVESCKIQLKKGTGMSLTENLVAAILAVMKQKYVSLTEFAEELGASHTDVWHARIITRF